MKTDIEIAQEACMKPIGEVAKSLGIEADDLHLYFREFKPFVGQCKFGLGCTHTHEPDCAIKNAVKNGEITKKRYESWMRIRDQIKDGSWTD